MRIGRVVKVWGSLSKLAGWITLKKVIFYDKFS